MKIFFGYMNLKSHFNSVLFGNITHSSTLESTYNPQFYTRYERSIFDYDQNKGFKSLLLVLRPLVAAYRMLKKFYNKDMFDNSPKD